eukprot:evm.model.scf_546EXC.3 EVM.evm.TU.scf_546EXC.3   scf_546EXC:57057-59005(+)
MQARLVIDTFHTGHPVVFVSDRILELTGYSREEILGKRWDVLQGWKTDSQAIAQVTKDMRAHKPACHELVLHGKDGRFFACLACCIPVLNHFGNSVKVVVALTDIEESGRCQAEERDIVRRQEKVSLERASGGKEMIQLLRAFMITDTNVPNAPITTVSPGFTSLTGFEPQDVLRLTSLCLCGPDTSKAAKKKFVAGHHKCRTDTHSMLWYCRY